MNSAVEKIYEYIKDVAEELFKLVVVALATATVYCGILYGGWYMWQVYLHTYTGATFKEMHPERFQQITEVLTCTPYWQTSLELAGVCALFMMAVALVSQFIYLRHLLYDPLWGVLKTAWAIALSFALAWLLLHYDGRLSFYESYVALLIPGMTCVLFSTMKSAPRIVPDIGSLVVSLISRIG